MAARSIQLGAVKTQLMQYHPQPSIQSSIYQAEDSFKESMPIKDLIDMAEKLFSKFILHEIMME